MVTRVKLDVSSPREFRKEIGKSFLDRIYSFAIDIKQVNKSFSTGAVFNSGDLGTSVMLIQLKNGDAILNLMDCTVIMNILKPDGKKVDLFCKTLDGNAGVLGIELPQQALNVVGVYKFELVVQSEEEIIYTPVLSYETVGNLGFDGSETVSKNEYTTLDDLVKSFNSFKTELEEIKKKGSSPSDDVKKEIEDLKKENAKLKQDMEKLNIKITLENLSKEHNTFRGQIGALNQMIIEAKAQGGSVTTENKELIETIEKENKSLKDQLKALAEKVNSIKPEERIMSDDEFSQSLETLENENSKLKKQISDIVNKMNSIKPSGGSTPSGGAIIDSDLKGTISELQARLEDLETLNDQVEKIDDAYRSVVTRVNDLFTRVGKLEEKIK